MRLDFQQGLCWGWNFDKVVYDQENNIWNGKLVEFQGFWGGDEKIGQNPLVIPKVEPRLQGFKLKEIFFKKYNSMKPR